MTLPAIAISIASTMLMLYSGLLFDPVLIRQLATRRHLHLFARLLLVNFIVIPLATLALISVAHLAPDLNLVLLALAMMPCAPIVPSIVSMVGEPPQWSLFLLLCFSLLSLLLLPVLLLILPQPWAAGDHARLGTVSYAGLALYVVTVYVPLFIGIAFRLRNEERGLSVQKLLRPWVSLSITATLLLFIFVHWQEITNLGWLDIGALMLFELMCVMAVLVFGPPWRAAPMTNILPSAFRNFTLGLALSSAVFPHTQALSYMIAFTMLMIPLVACAVVVQRRWLCLEMPR